MFYRYGIALNTMETVYFCIY